MKVGSWQNGEKCIEDRKKVHVKGEPCKIKPTVLSQTAADQDVYCLKGQRRSHRIWGCQQILLDSKAWLDDDLNRLHKVSHAWLLKNKDCLRHSTQIRQSADA